MKRGVILRQKATFVSLLEFQLIINVNHVFVRERKWQMSISFPQLSDH